MGFESVRGYVHLASGLTEATKARATGAAQGLLSLPAAGISTGSKVAVQAGALAEEMLSVATTNHSSLTALVRSEVEVAVTRLGLVSAERLEEAQAEATRLRTEVARLRAASSMVGPVNNTTTTTKTTTKKADSARRTKSGAPSMNGAANATSITTSARKSTKATKATSASPKKAANTASTARTATGASTATKPARTRRSAVSTRAKPAGA